MTIEPDAVAMRLRRVTLTGFKTFARRTEVVLDPGVTAVVGPNGSGKSNLVDAIRWALGETNARELRGARMDEVIHSGGEGRSPLGMATVDLVLDNESGRLPVDDAEVSISRRVTRHGDSEYRLNGARVRLRDLERLLGATGLTQTGYSVVAQNDIDSIIEASPGQRRSLVEEAAGVRGLRSAREDALDRVGATETRLLRLADLLADAEPRLAGLAGQAQLALEQRALTARLAELRGSLAREAWRAARSQVRRGRARLTTAEARAEAAAEADAGFSTRIEQERARFAATLEARAAAVRALESARLTAERVAGDRRRFDDRAAEAGLQRAAGRLEELAALEEADGAARSVAELAGAGDEATSLLEVLIARRQALTATEREAARVRSDAQAELARVGAELEEATRLHADAEARARGHATRAAVLDENAAALAASADAAADRVAELIQVSALAGRRAEDLEAAARAAAQRCQVTGQRAATARERLRTLEAEQAAALGAAREAEARAAALRGQVEVTLGVGAVARGVGDGRLAGARLLERLRVLDPTDRAALEAALEAQLGAFIVDDLDAAALVLSAGAATIREEVLDAGATAGADDPAVEGARRAADAVAMEGGAEGVVARLLAGVRLAPDMATARRAVEAGARSAILPDGTVISATGIRGGGRPGEALALTVAERDARAALGEARAAERRLAARVTEAAAAATAAASDAEVGATAAEASRRVAAEAAAAAAGASVAVAAEQQRNASLLGERATREAAATTAREAAAVADAESSWAAERRATIEARVAGARERLEEALDDAGAAAAASREHDLEMARAEPEARDVQRRLAAARGLAARSLERSRVAALRLAAAEDAAVAALARGRAAVRLGVAAAAGVAAAEAGVAAADAPVVTLEARVRRLEEERGEVAVAAARAADELAASRAELAAAEARVAELAELVREDEQDDGPEPEAAAAEKVEREITRLERRVAGLGPVNGLAPEQHAHLAERVGRLRHDHDDLSVACIDLRLLADHLAVEIEARFHAVFGAVAYHFRLLFEELFPGGRATLRLEEPAAEEPDTESPGPRARRRGPAGVEILAQPAGKRLQNLSLLSGGERALTALAVILALQQVNPSPFYVFDEVDAPLDDANIGRFTRLLRRLAQTQQFLVVTHNHATMAAADALYGVTMGVDGISRLLSVRLNASGGTTAAPQREKAGAVAS